MARKTPDQQIAAAREMLARAQARQRQMDTRVKIIAGALTLSWLREDPRAARAFMMYMEAHKVREQDAEVLADLLLELREVVRTAQQAAQVNHVS